MYRAAHLPLHLPHVVARFRIYQTVSSPFCVPRRSFPTRQSFSTCADVALGDLAVYIHSEINGTFDDIHSTLSDLIDVLELPNDGSLTRVSISDAKILVEEIGACPGNLETFLSQYDDADKAVTVLKKPGYEFPTLASGNLSEYDEYPTNRDLIKLAALRGAKIDKEDSGMTTITTASGMRIVLTTKDKREDKYASDRKRKLKQLMDGGIRVNAADSQQHRFCKVCSKFLLEADIAACPSGYQACLNQSR